MPSPLKRDRFAAILRRLGNPYRLASCVLVLYAIGHTAGAVISTPRLGAAADAVATTMKSVHFDAQGFEVSWYGFYLGFGWFVSLFFILSAVISWHIGGLPMRDRAGLAAITWSLCLSYVGSVAIAWKCLFAAPIAFSSIVALLLATGCVRDAIALRATI
jgi:hypothetical protein